MTKNSCTQEFSLPVHWAHYLINNGRDGYTQAELDAMQAWTVTNRVGNCLNADLENSRFTWSGDDVSSLPFGDSRLGADRCAFHFPVEAA